MEILELFSGYASWSNPFKQNGNKIYTLDIDCKFNPSICEDILTWKYKEFAINPDIIFASPDCTYFSNARARWGFPEDKIELTKSLWDKTFEIISYFKPEYYLIENPVGKARHYFPGYRTIDYCAYGYNYYGIYIKKPTDLWTNINIDFKRCDKTHTHFSNFGDVIRDKAKRSVIPSGLVNEIKNKIYSLHFIQNFDSDVK